MVKDVPKKPGPESSPEFQDLKKEIMDFLDREIGSALCGYDFVAAVKNPSDPNYREGYAKQVEQYINSIPASIRSRSTVLKMVDLMVPGSNPKMFSKLGKEIERKLKEDPLNNIRLERVEIRIRNVPFSPALKAEVEKKSGGKDVLEGEGFTVVDFYVLFRDGHAPRATRH